MQFTLIFTNAYFQEIEFMTGSLQQLKEVQQKFVKSQETLGTITPENDGKDILLPLTSSVSLKLCDQDEIVWQASNLSIVTIIEE